MAEQLDVAILQSAPAYGDLPACMERLREQVAQAARDGARLVVAGETCLPGYPAWLDHCPEMAMWGQEATKALHARLRENSIGIPGPDCDALGRIAAEHEVVLVVGVQERPTRGPGQASLYNSALIFDADGSLANHHRKLVPTYTEKLVWAPGDGAGLKVVETAVGRVGALICWEHWMPLARQAMHDGGEQIHVALWPWVHEIHQMASRHYAFEGRCFVLAAGMIHAASDLPSELKYEGDAEAMLLRGGSSIYAPDGSSIVEPLLDRETIVHAKLDLGLRDRESMTLDVSGHYARPDIFDFAISRERRD